MVIVNPSSDVWSLNCNKDIQIMSAK